MYKTEAIGKASKDAPLEKIMVGRESKYDIYQIHIIS